MAELCFSAEMPTAEDKRGNARANRRKCTNAQNGTVELSCRKAAARHRGTRRGWRC